jgi:hypothetical protein
MDPRKHIRPDSEPYHQILERVAEDWGLESSRTPFFGTASTMFMKPSPATARN